MARWMLNAAHYLFVEDIDGEKIEYEYTEIDTNTQRRRKRAFSVPMLLDPKDQTLHNDNGTIVVSNGDGNRGPRDYIFKGEPTPDMAPLDDEARAISAFLQSKWINAIESLPSNGDFSQSMITMFERQMEGIAKIVDRPQAVSLAGVDPEEFKKMQEQLAQLMAQNAELKAAGTDRRSV